MARFQGESEMEKKSWIKAPACLQRLSVTRALQRFFFPFQKLRFGGRQSNVSMTITASGVTGTDISTSILRVFELLFHLYLTRR